MQGSNGNEDSQSPKSPHQQIAGDNLASIQSNLKFHVLDQSNFTQKRPKNRKRNMYLPTKAELEQYSHLPSSAVADIFSMSKTKIIYLRFSLSFFFFSFFLLLISSSL